jgi:hypothetical protein
MSERSRRAATSYVVAVVCLLAFAEAPAFAANDAPAAGADAPVTDTPAADAPAADVAAKPLAPAAPPPAGEPLDYRDLGHTIVVTMLRAGSHDDGGTNDYYFKVALIAARDAAADRGTDDAKRKRIEVPLGEFGATRIASLSIWHADEKSRDVKTLHVDGEKLRELAARAMRELSAAEAEVALETRITMMKKAKRYFVLSDDKLVGSVAYPPLASGTSGKGPSRETRLLSIADALGAFVKLEVHFDKPPAVAAAPGAAPLIARAASDSEGATPARPAPTASASPSP